MSSLKSYSIEGLQQAITEAGLPKYRANQILSWLYCKHVRSFDQMTNLSKQLRASLSDTYTVDYPVALDAQRSIDGTRKYVLRFSDSAIAECVGIPSDDGRLTVCCSTQAGCAMGCSFCATGQNGLTRNLLPGEIADQISFVSDDFGSRVSNVVLMGQGEPFLNYDNVIAALHIINASKLFDIGARRITVSTCGIVPGIRRFAEEPEQFTLAVSLHSARQETRDELMPGVSKYDLKTLRSCISEYTHKTNRRVTFEYALIKGVNDDSAHLKSLIDYCHGMLCHVNLIQLNRIEGSTFQPSPANTQSRWIEALNDRGITATLRNSRGSDIAGACGQLANTLR